MENPSAKFLADAIRAHRENGNDDALYLKLTTYEVAENHGQTADDFLRQATAFVRASL